MKLLLERHAALLAWLAGLGIPIALLLGGWLITTSIERSKLDSEYVRIALGILTAQGKQESKKNSPEEDKFSDDENALRGWAIRLLNSRSPEKFSESEQAALLRTRKPFGVIGGAEFFSHGVYEDFAGFRAEELSVTEPQSISWQSPVGPITIQIGQETTKKKESDGDPGKSAIQF